MFFIENRPSCGGSLHVVFVAKQLLGRTHATKRSRQYDNEVSSTDCESSRSDTCRVASCDPVA